jgi:HSP20 family protein
MANTGSNPEREREMARWDPFENISPFGLTFGRLFDDMLGRRQGESDRLIAPLVDVSEDENHLTITAELPGLRKEDVKIQVENNVLSISGEKRLEKEEKDKNFHRLERRYGSFYRAIALPQGVSTDQADAEFKDGVLNIRLPKREDVKPRTLPIK